MMMSGMIIEVSEKANNLHDNQSSKPLNYLLPECPPTLSGKRRFYCPSRNEQNEWICVTSEQICDTRIDCPNGHDEEDLMCFYHRPVSFKQ